MTRRTFTLSTGNKVELCYEPMIGVAIRFLSRPVCEADKAAYRQQQPRFLRALLPAHKAFRILPNGHAEIVARSKSGAA